MNMYGLKADYVTGSVNVPPLSCPRMYSPFTMVIDLNTGIVIGMDDGDTMTFLTVQQILNLVKQADI
jgi:hypothetical protein